MYCKACGSLLGESDTICKVCGEEVETIFMTNENPDDSNVSSEKDDVIRKILYGGEDDGLTARERIEQRRQKREAEKKGLYERITSPRESEDDTHKPSRINFTKEFVFGSRKAEAEVEAEEEESEVPEQRSTLFDLKMDKEEEATFVFNKKNEEFQELLDQEYEKLRKKQETLEDARSQVGDNLLTESEPAPEILVTSGVAAASYIEARIEEYLKNADYEMLQGIKQKVDQELSKQEAEKPEYFGATDEVAEKAEASEEEDQTIESPFEEEVFEREFIPDAPEEDEFVAAALIPEIAGGAILAEEILGDDSEGSEESVIEEETVEVQSEDHEEVTDTEEGEEESYDDILNNIPTESDEEMEESVFENEVIPDAPGEADLIEDMDSEVSDSEDTDGESLDSEDTAVEESDTEATTAEDGESSWLEELQRLTASMESDMGPVIGAPTADEVSAIIDQPIVFPFDEETTAEKDPASEVSEEAEMTEDADSESQSASMLPVGVATAENTDSEKDDSSSDDEDDEDDDDDDDEKPKSVAKRVIGSILLILAIIIVLVVLLSVVVMKFWPNSEGAYYVKDAIELIQDKLGIGSGSSSDDSSASDTSDSDVNGPIEDKDLLVASQLFNNVNIGSVSSDSTAAFNSTVPYSISGANDSKPIESNLMGTDKNGVQLLFDEQSVGTVMGFASDFVPFVNEAKADILNRTNSGDAIHKFINAEKEKYVAPIEFVYLGIGDVRQNSDTYFVWTKEIIKDNDGVETVSYKLYSLIESDKEMKINGVEIIR